LEQKLKERKKKRREEGKDEEEGVVYRVNYKGCEKIYIGETKFKMGKRIINNTIAKHVEEKDHQTDWDNAVVLEKERRLFSRKIL
jgi:hypothetical protein